MDILRTQMQAVGIRLKAEIEPVIDHKAGLAIPAEILQEFRQKQVIPVAERFITQLQHRNLFLYADFGKFPITQSWSGHHYIEPKVCHFRLPERLALIIIAAFTPESSIPPKIGPILLLPLTPQAAIPDTNSPG